MIKEEFKKPEDIEERQPWIYTYGDLFTLLVAFFIIIATQVPKSPLIERQTTSPPLSGISPGSPYFFEGSPLIVQNEYNVIEEITERNDEVDITLDDRGIVISFSSNIGFAAGSATLSPTARRIIRSFSDLLFTVPNSIVIEGHTDSVPINTNRFPSNWNLSAERAANVALEFERNGIKSQRLEVVAYADTRPKVRNINAVSRAINRRIEILVKPY